MHERPEVDGRLPAQPLSGGGRITDQVVDLGRTKAYFESKGITLVRGDMPDSLMLTAEDNRGAIVQFSE